MRKPTPHESVFLAGTLTVSILATVEIVPDVVQKLKEDAQQASLRQKNTNYLNPADSFTAGLIIGLVAGAIGATKVIADKMNNP